MTDADVEKAAALERKKRRLEAWRKRQEDKAKADESAQPNKPKVTLSLGVNKLPKKKKKKAKRSRPLGFGVFGGDDGDGEGDDGGAGAGGREEKKSLDLFDIKSVQEEPTNALQKSTNETVTSSPPKKKRRWDANPNAKSIPQPLKSPSEETGKEKDDIGNGNGDDRKSVQPMDDLDIFMNELESGAMGKVVKKSDLSIDVGGSMIRPSTSTKTTTGGNSNPPTPMSGGVITPEELAKLMGGDKGKSKKESRKEDGAFYGPSDWETSASEVSHFFSSHYSILCVHYFTCIHQHALSTHSLIYLQLLG